MMYIMAERWRRDLQVIRTDVSHTQALEEMLYKTWAYLEKLEDRVKELEAKA